MRIFAIAPLIPNPSGKAIEVASYEAVRTLLSLGQSVSLQVLTRNGSISSAQESQLGSLRQMGIDVMPLMSPAERWRGINGNGLGRPVSRARRLLFPTQRDLFVEAALRPEVERRIRATGPDVVLTLFTPNALAATFRSRAAPKVTYLGMPAHAAGEARLNDPDLFDVPRRSVADRLRLFAGRVRARQRRNLGFKMTLDNQVVGTVCAFHAQMYSDLGHPRARYIPLMWPDRYGERWREMRRARETKGPARLLGSLGDLGATGNTFGLHYLATQVVPALKRWFDAGGLEIHVFGAGKPHKVVAEALADPMFKVRGFVSDIDAEVLACKLFLIMNNAGPLKGPHTRFLHAWSLGACVVAHADNADAIPEVRHMHNALLGKTPEEIAGLIALALDDETLRQRIGEEGRRTFESCFTPAAVVPRLLEELQWSVAAWG